MNKLVAVVFRDVDAASEAVRVFSELNAEASIDVAMLCVIKKEPDGKISTKEVDDGFPIRALAGTALGALVGFIAGGVGAAIGAATGLLAGLIDDLYSAGVDGDFVSEVATALTAGKCAVVAEVDEEWVTPLDTRMEALGGVVYRTLKSTAKQERRKRDIAGAKVLLSQLKIEIEQARADRKAKLQAQIDSLNKLIDAKLGRAQARAKQATREFHAKIHALRQKAEKHHGEAKAAVEARVAKLRKDYENRS